MHPRQLRVGDLVDDYCPRERRLTNHAVVAHGRRRRPPGPVHHLRRRTRVPSRATAGQPQEEARRRAAPAAAVRGALRRRPPATGPAEAAPNGPSPAGHRGVTRRRSLATSAAGTARPDRARRSPHPGHDGPFHRRLIRATLPRIEGATRPSGRFPEFTMHHAAPATAPPRQAVPPRAGAAGSLATARKAVSARAGPARRASGNGFGPPRPHGQRGARGAGRRPRQRAAATAAAGADPAAWAAPRPASLAPRVRAGKPPRGPKKH